MSRILIVASLATLFIAGTGAAAVLTPSASARHGCPGKACRDKVSTAKTKARAKTRPKTAKAKRPAGIVNVQKKASRPVTPPRTTPTTPPPTTTQATTPSVPTSTSTTPTTTQAATPPPPPTTTATTTAATTTTQAPTPPPATTTVTTTTTQAPTPPPVTTTTQAPTPPPPPTSGSASSIYWGAYIDGNDTYASTYGDAPWDLNTWNRYAADAGKQPSIVHWGVPAPWSSSFNNQLSAHQAVVRAGALSLLDMDSGSVPLADIAAGRYDASITTWAQQAAAFGHPFFLRWDWEMNGSWFPWGTTSSNQSTAADFVSSWRHMHDLFLRAGATNVTWVWCPNTVFNGSTALGSLYPGDAYVDWTCVDAYNKGGAGWISFSNLFSPSYAQVLQVAPSKPMMIGETSSAEDGGSKAAWITAALGSLPSSFPAVRAYVWFNWKIAENGATWPWQIESSASAQAAFAAGIGSSYFKAGGSLAPQNLAPIQPLP